MVYQRPIPLTAPAAGQQLTWSGVLAPSDWSGGCQDGLYAVVLIAVAPGTALSDVLAETPAELANYPNAELSVAKSFTCQG